jgi:drug/metabolite transporter (DMT)-like permease
VTLRKYLVLAAVALFGSIGDTLLSRGMRGMPPLGEISLHNLPHIVGSVFSPWVIAGIVCLLVFMAAYLAALSWADLTYVLPTTAFGYFLMALMARVFLHEHISGWRWVGVILIMAAVGIVANGPELTRHANETEAEPHTKAPIARLREKHDG